MRMEDSLLARALEALENNMTEEQDQDHMLDNHDIDQCVLCELRQTLKQENRMNMKQIREEATKKRNAWEVYRVDRDWYLQFPKGRMAYKTKREALRASKICGGCNDR